MKKKFLISILFAILSFAVVTLAGCEIFGGMGDSSDKQKTISISLPQRAEINSNVEISVDSNFYIDSYNLLKFEIVGENTINAKISTTYQKCYIKAELPGTLTIKCAYCPNNEIVAESNTASIEFYANTISTVEELKSIADSNKNYLLSNDIDLSGESKWIPIENFSGTINGDGHSIKNLKIEVRSGDNSGLFGELKGTVMNLKLENVDISGTGSGNNVGAIAGTNSGTIKNCEVSGNINCEYATYVGGIVGCSNIKLFDNVNNATVSSNENVGGITGAIKLKLKDKEDENTVIGDGNVNNGNIFGKTSIGGIFGAIECFKNNNYAGTYYISTSENKNNGKVSATGNNVGGIAGRLAGLYTFSYYAYIKISDCENTGVVSGKDNVGGIYGYGESVSSATTCINTADIIGSNYVGGFIGRSSGTEVSNMVNENKILGNGYLGGVAGYAGNVKNCKNNGQVISEGTILEDDVNKYCVGGIVGYCNGIIGCQNDANINVTLEGRGVGGVAGEIYCTNSIEDNANTGEVKAQNCTNVGGIVGRIRFKGTQVVKNNINEGAISGSKYCGGIFGYAESINYSTSTSTVTGKDNVTIGDCDNKGKISATVGYAGGIVGELKGYKGSYYQVYISISSNNNYATVTAPEYFGAIAGHANTYVNVNNEVLWPSNNDFGGVGKLYN